MTEADLTRLHQAYAEPAYRLAWSVTADESLAKDVVQEVFLKLVRQPSLLEGVQSERAMIFTMARNLALDALRRRRTRDDTQQRWSRELPQWFEPTIDDDSEERQQHIVAALVALPEEQRTAVHLHLWEGLSFREIGEIEGLPTQTIASRYRYGLDKLRAALHRQNITTPAP